MATPSGKWPIVKDPFLTGLVGRGEEKHGFVMTASLNQGGRVAQCAHAFLMPVPALVPLLYSTPPEG